jgi:Zn-dependent protease
MVLGGDPVAFVIGSIFLIPAVLVAAPLHELGHGLAAVLMGDPSARNQGYNLSAPRRLFNVYGVVAAFLANVTWGRPIRVNEYRLDGVGRKLGYVLGGPAANLLLAIGLGALLRLLARLGVIADRFTFAQPPAGYVATIVLAMFFLNLATFAFQLLPVPGLDGWRVVETLFRGRNPRFFFSVAANTQTIWMVAIFAVILAPLVLHVRLLDDAIAIFFQPVSNGILGKCVPYVALDPCLR